MKKWIPILLILMCAVACKFGGGPTVEQELPTITSVEVLDMTLVSGRDVPIVVNNQDGVNVNKYVNVTPVNHNDAVIRSKCLIKAKREGNIDFIVSFFDKEQKVTLKSINESDFINNVPIGILQSPSHFSPYNHMYVQNIKGVVTGTNRYGFAEGFYIQSENPDNFAETSEGIWVNVSGYIKVQPGDRVVLSGAIYEKFIHFKKKSLTTTSICSNASKIQIVGQTNLPDSVKLTERKPPSSFLSSGGNLNSYYSHVFDCHNDGIDFWESLEGMLVEVEKPIVVSPYAYGSFFVLNNEGIDGGDKTNRGGILLRKKDANPEKIGINVIHDRYNNLDKYNVNVGDSFSGNIIAPVGYDWYFKCPMLDVSHVSNLSNIWTTKVDGGLDREETAITNGSDKLTVAAFNINNYYYRNNYYYKMKTKDLAETIGNRLNSPDIIAIAEMMDNNGSYNNGTVSAKMNANKLITHIKKLSGTQYFYIDINPENNQDGGKPGGNIRVGYLYNPARVQLVPNTNGAGDSTEDVEVTNVGGKIGLNHNPVRIIDRAFDKSRKPLLAHFQFNGKDLYLINVHFSSKYKDDAAWGHIQPPHLNSEDKRISQCEAVNDVVDDLLEVDGNANIIVLGDVNDFTWSKPIRALTDTVLESVVDNGLSENERYSYIFMGNSQLLDNIFVSKNLKNNTEVDIVHSYCEFRKQYSDHDPIIASIVLK